MAIRIITNGHIYKKATCKYCGCVFEYEKEDVIEDPDAGIDNYGISWRTDYYIEHCPFCNRRVDVEKFKNDDRS